MPIVSHIPKWSQLSRNETPTVVAVGREFAEKVAAGCANIISKIVTCREATNGVTA